MNILALSFILTASAYGIYLTTPHKDQSSCEVVIEVCIALEPDSGTAADLGALSRHVAHDSIFTLDREDRRLQFAPHLTLYQCALKARDLDKAALMLKRAASSSSVITTGPGLYRYNAERSVEVYWKDYSSLLSHLQGNVIESLNSLRKNLQIERDPAGNCVETMLGFESVYRGKEEERVKNLREYGFAEGIQLFNPHVTLGWFENGEDKQHGDYPCKQTIVRRLAELVDMPSSFTFNSIAMYALGPHGTCPQRLSYHPLR